MFEKNIIDFDREINLLEEENFEISKFLEKQEISGQKSCNFINYLNYQNENIDNEIKRLQNLKKGNENKIENVKKYLKYLLNQGVKDFGLFKISLRKSSSVEIDDIDINIVPDEFINEKITKTISKTKIKEFLEKPAFIDSDTGEVAENFLKFARIIENENLLIK